MEQSFKNVATNINERIMTHILIRPLIENYFKLLYIYDDPAKSHARFDESVNEFKSQYAKLWNDPAVPHKNQIEPADPSWRGLRGAMDLNSMLTALLNVHGDRLNYI